MNSSFLRSLGLFGVMVGCAIAICVLYVLWAEGNQFEKRLAKCQRSMQAGDLAGARLELLRLHAEDDSHSGVIELLAEVEIRLGNPRQAIDWYKRVPESARAHACAARKRAAQLAMHLGHGQATEALAREAIRLDPTAVEPRKLLLRYYFVLLEHRKMCEQSVALDSLGQLSVSDLLMRCVAQRASWDDDGHVTWLEQCLRRDPANAAVRAALARNYAARGRNEAATDLLADARSEASVDWRIQLARAEQHIDAGRFEQALPIVAGLPVAACGESRTWLAQAKVWTEAGDAEAALVALENATRLDPYDPTPSYAMARIRLAQGDDADAAALLQHSSQLKELMGKLRLLLEASNPAYQTAEPAAVTMQSAIEAFRQLGFDREAAILTKSGRGGKGARSKCTHPPLTMVAIDNLAKPQPRRGSPRGLEVRGIHLVDRQRAEDGSRLINQDLRFQDVAGKIQLTFQYDTGKSPFRWLMETLGGGVAVLDFDGDGWDDLYLTQGGPLPVVASADRGIDRLFQNIEGEVVRDVTATAHLVNGAFGQGCAVGDYDNDGFADLVVCNYGAFLVFRNQGDGTFEDVGQTTGIQSSHWNTSASFSDLDRDGDLDLYVVQYLDAEFPKLKPCKFRGAYTSCRPFAMASVQDILWENLGDGSFADRTAEFGLNANDGKGLGVAIVDFEGQGRESIFVGNDTTANFLFRPSTALHGPRFHEVGVASGVAVNGQGLTEACMGVAIGDVNGDGRFDLFVTNFLGETNTLYQAIGDGQFIDATERAGLAQSSRDRMGFGCQFLDVDCDGFLDLFVANGQLHEIPQRPQLYYNQGTGRFAEVSQEAGAYFRTPRMGRSVARLDWNRDLVMDLAVTYQEGSTSLLENRSVVGNRIMLQCLGASSNRDAVGALIRARIGERTLHFYATRGGGYFAANDPKIHIGCGDAARIDQLDVIWPSGHIDSWRDVVVGKSYLAIEGRERLWTRGG